ncbi:LpqN/LpqT family lipoprotein [Nocardia sp. NEAU-G5]|uniref:LpqN/LpqT family lipoprotein n=1 Tax=Nocardia albiluteola TaxID=2842303 RepID=A0ABS6ATL1_9NOCA|nr:LpqN/LpqT family lipoprotein [Nocardia albiluteola]MBU3060915.1 LpqN/LpqT family lipoprotein [Nocardia albiluteola]
MTAAQELALPTVGEFLSAVGVAAQVVYPEHPGAPVVSLDIPYDWHEVIREVLPAAFGAWALPPEEDAPPQEAGWVDNAVVMVWRMSRPVDPAAVMRCAFTDSRRLPDWQERRTKTEDCDGFPSAAISGTYTFGELSLWVSTRYLMAGTPTGQYLLQLSVTTRAYDDRDGRFIAGSLGVQSPIMQPPPAAHALRSEPSGPHTRPEPAVPPLQSEPPAPLAWSEAEPVARPESAAHSGPLASVARSDYSPAEMRSGPLDSVRRAESPLAWSESLDSVVGSDSLASELRPESVESPRRAETAVAWSESSNSVRRADSPVVWSESLDSVVGSDSLASELRPESVESPRGAQTAVGWSESSDSFPRNESPVAWSESPGVDEWADEGEWDESSDARGRTKSAGGGSFASRDVGEWTDAGEWSEPADSRPGAESAAAWSDSADSAMRDESDAVWTGPLEAVGGSESAAGVRSDAVRSELAGEGWSRERAPLAWSEAPDVDGRSEAAPLAWSEAPDLEGRSESMPLAWSESPDLNEVESAGGAWSESSDEGEWGDEDDWDESDEDEGEWVEEDEEADVGESAEPEPPVTWAETPSLVVRSESVAAGGQSEPPPVVRDALLPVLGAESGPEPEADAHRSGNVDFHI